MQQASQFKAEGRFDEAKELAEKARRMDAESRERDPKKADGAVHSKDEWFSNMKREIEELRRAGKNEEAERRTQEVREAWQRDQAQNGKQREYGSISFRRLQ